MKMRMEKEAAKQQTAESQEKVSAKEEEAKSEQERSIGPRKVVPSTEELERQLHTRLIRQILTCVAYLTEHYRAVDEDEQVSGHS